MMKLVLCGILSACGVAIALAGAAQADPIKLRIGYGVAGRGTALEFLKANAVAIRALLAYLSAATKYYLEKPLAARQILLDS
jgi:hypothetical protein